MTQVSAAWHRVVDELRAGSAGIDDPSVRPVILESWRRSRDAGVDPTAPVLLCHVEDADLLRRQAEYRKLLDAAIQPIDSFSLSLGRVKHVVYMTDADGIVLYARGTDYLMRSYGLRPGFDWSEPVMGTNGAGTALACNAPVAVLGPEHWTLPFHDASCLASPIRDREGRAVAALDLSTRVVDCDPAQLEQVIALAREIERKWLLEAGSASA